MCVAPSVASLAPHATTSQSSTWPTSHHSHASLNIGREGGTNEYYHLAGMMVEESHRENDAHADSNLPVFENHGRYLEGQQPEF